jgi:hypothetical protein
MKKYVTPSIENAKIESNDIISASTQAPVSYASLEGVDKEDEKTAIYNVEHWLSNLIKK